MFRRMRRFKQELSREDCLALLAQEKRGVLSLLGDDGYPYGIPMNHWYDPETGNLYFHGAKSGHKLDAIRACDKVSYCVYDKGYRNEGEWWLNVKSVVLFGRLHVVEDHDAMVNILTRLCKKFTDDQSYLDYELANSMVNVLCLELTPEHISGKLVSES